MTSNTKSRSNSTFIEEIYQEKMYQAKIIFGFDRTRISPVTLMIDHFVDSIDGKFFVRETKSNNIIGGRPPSDYRILFKIYLYSLYHDISFRNLEKFATELSELTYLCHGMSKFPERKLFSRFLKHLDTRIDNIFDLFLEYAKKFISLDVNNLFCDGTVFEAHNSRNKVITDVNIARSNKKWKKILEDPNSSIELKEKAGNKLDLNKGRTKKLNELNRNSFGRTDEDCVILQDKNKSFIAGYNCQFIVERNHGLIVYAHLSNKNPDSAAFLDMIDSIIKKLHPKTLTMDAGYGTPDILIKLRDNNITPIVKTVKGENAKSKITNYSFELSEDENFLICPDGQMLEKVNTKMEGKTAFKAKNCHICPQKSDCLGKTKNKRIAINLAEFKAIKEAERATNSAEGKEAYTRRGYMCESPHGFIKYNLNGKKFIMKGLIRNNIVIKCHSILFNLVRVFNIKNGKN